jgi:hypothetical protein
LQTYAAGSGSALTFGRMRTALLREKRVRKNDGKEARERNTQSVVDCLLEDRRTTRELFGEDDVGEEPCTGRVRDVLNVGRSLVLEGVKGEGVSVRDERDDEVLYHVCSGAMVLHTHSRRTGKLRSRVDKFVLDDLVVRGEDGGGRDESLSALSAEGLEEEGTGRLLDDGCAKGKGKGQFQRKE